MPQLPASMQPNAQMQHPAPSAQQQQQAAMQQQLSAMTAASAATQQQLLQQYPQQFAPGASLQQMQYQQQRLMSCQAFAQQQCSQQFAPGGASAVSLMGQSSCLAPPQMSCTLAGGAELFGPAGMGMPPLFGPSGLPELATFPGTGGLAQAPGSSGDRSQSQKDSGALSPVMGFATAVAPADAVAPVAPPAPPRNAASSTTPRWADEPVEGAFQMPSGPPPPAPCQRISVEHFPAPSVSALVPGGVPAAAPGSAVRSFAPGCSTGLLLGPEFGSSLTAAPADRFF
jgi:hypothetical protein